MAETLHFLRIASAITGGAILTFCLVCTVYLFVIIFAGFCARHRRKIEFNYRDVSFAILIPAHDEELLIAQTVRSARSIDYPQDKFKVFVVADNCSDATATKA